MLYGLFLIFCLYLPFQIALNPAKGVDLASGRVFILILALLWLISGLKKRRIFIPAKIQTWLILSFLFISGFSLFWASNLDWGLRKLLFLLSIFPVYFVVSGILYPSPYKGEGAYGRILKYVVWGAGLAGAVGIVQFLLQFIIGLDPTAALWRNYVTPLFLGSNFSRTVLEYPSWLVNIGGTNYLRAFGTFPDPHMFSFYLGLTLPLAIGLYYACKKNSYLIFSMIILLADLLTFSRGAYLGLVAGLIFMALYFMINKKLSAKIILAGFMLAILASVLIIFSPIGQRLVSSFNAEEGSNKGRFENWTQAIEIIKNNPQGIGIGNYSYEIEPSADYRKPIYAHNLYLDIAAETGIINSVILILILIFTTRSFVIKAKDNIIYLGGAISLVIYSTHSIFDTSLYSVQVLPLILIIIALGASDNYTLNHDRR